MHFPEAEGDWIQGFAQDCAIFFIKKVYINIFQQKFKQKKIEMVIPSKKFKLS